MKQYYSLNYEIIKYKNGKKTSYKACNETENGKRYLGISIKICKHGRFGFVEIVRRFQN